MWQRNGIDRGSASRGRHGCEVGQAQRKANGWDSMRRGGSATTWTSIEAIKSAGVLAGYAPDIKLLEHQLLGHGRMSIQQAGQEPLEPKSLARDGSAPMRIQPSAGNKLAALLLQPLTAAERFHTGFLVLPFRGCSSLTHSPTYSCSTSRLLRVVVAEFAILQPRHVPLRKIRVHRSLPRQRPSSTGSWLHQRARFLSFLDFRDYWGYFNAVLMNGSLTAEVIF